MKNILSRIAEMENIKSSLKEYFGDKVKTLITEYGLTDNYGDILNYDLITIDDFYVSKDNKIVVVLEQLLGHMDYEYTWIEKTEEEWNNI